jgi:hypothetical protein
MIARSITIAGADFPCLWAEAGNLGAYLKNSVPHKHLPSSTIPFGHFHSNRPIISDLNPFGSKCYVHIQEDEHSSDRKYLPHAREAIIVGYTSSPKIYRVFTLEDEYAFTTRDLTFSEKTCPEVATTLQRISQDLDPDPGSTPQDLGPKDPSTTTSVYTRILAEDIVLDQDWCWYLLKFPDEAVTFYNVAIQLVVGKFRLSMRLIQDCRN